MASPGEEPKVSREYLLGQLRAALRPSRVSLAEVRRVLRLIVYYGYPPVEMYHEALQSRPDNYDPPPLLAEVLPKDLPKESQLDVARGEVLTKRKPPGSDSETRSEDSKQESREES